jgi:hypothetical protein
LKTNLLILISEKPLCKGNYDIKYFNIHIEYLLAKLAIKQCKNLCKENGEISHTNISPDQVMKIPYKYISLIKW